MNFKVISAIGLALFWIGSVPMAPAAVVHYGLMDALILYQEPPGPEEPNPSEDKNKAQGSKGAGHEDEQPGQEGEGHENHKGFGYGHEEASPSD